MATGEQFVSVVMVVSLFVAVIGAIMANLAIVGASALWFWGARDMWGRIMKQHGPLYSYPIVRS